MRPANTTVLAGLFDPSAGRSRSRSRQSCRERKAGIPVLDHRQRLGARGQRPRPQVRHRRPVHPRRRGGVPAARSRDVRPRPAHRHDARRGHGTRARGADQRRAHAVGARDHDARLPQRRRRHALADEAPRLRHRDRARAGHARRLGRHAPVQPLRAPADHREGSLPRAHRPAAVRRAARAHLRDARARRGRRAGEGDPGRERAAPASRAAPRDVRELAVLARRADRARVEPADGLLGVPALGPAAALPRLRRLRRRSSGSSSARAASPTTRTSGGTSACTRGSGRSRSASATP